MNMKPVIFSTPMVKAILDNKKFQTRRVIKWQPYHKDEKINFSSSGMSLGYYCTGVPESGYVLYSMSGGCWNQRTKPMHPPWKPGDILYVRETFAYDGYWGEEPMYGEQTFYPNGKYIYKADRNSGFNPYVHKWRPSIHMPRAAARLFLCAKDVRVERLQDITDEDAIAEGALTIPNMPEYQKAFDEAVSKGEKPPLGESPRQRFKRIWNALNAKRGAGWDTNPWVTVTTFERTEVPHGD